MKSKRRVVRDSLLESRRFVDIIYAVSREDQCVQPPVPSSTLINYGIGLFRALALPGARRAADR